MSKYDRLYTLTRGASLLACGLSLAFSVWYWGSLADGALQWIYIGCGLVFDITKMIAISFAIYFFSKKCMAKLLVCSLVFGLLSLVSIYSSISVLQDANLAAKEASLAKSLAHQELVEAIAGKKRYIAQLESVATKDYDAGYKTRANANLKIIATENDKLQQLQSRLANEESIKLSQPLDGNFVSAMMMVILGSLLEVVTSFLLFLSATQEGSSSEESRNLLPEEASSSEEPLRNPGTFLGGTFSANDDFYHEVEEQKNVVNLCPGIRGTQESLAPQGVDKTEEPRNLLTQERSPREEGRNVLLEEASSEEEPLRNPSDDSEEPLADLVNELKAKQQKPSIKNLKISLGCAYDKAKLIQQQLIDNGFVHLNKNRPVWVG